MLPGFRFLFAAFVLSTSMLIFGLGAAALLRAAHEEFASIPSRRLPPETMFAQQGDAGQTLAMLRVEPSADEKAIEPPAADQPAIDSASADAEKPATESEKVAALETATPVENPAPSGMSTSDAAAPEMPIEAKTQAEAGAPSSEAETKAAAIAEITPAAPEQSATTQPDQASRPIDESTRIAETRIATLGGPPVTIETQTPSKIARAVVRKSAQAKRVVQRRRIVQRARVTQQAPQTPAAPFARPLGR
jgi:hypothetical protein